MRRFALTLILLIQLNIPEYCTLDQVQITFIPPNSLRIFETYECVKPDRICWRRYIQQETKILGLSEVCNNYGDTLNITPLSNIPNIP